MREALNQILKRTTLYTFSALILASEALARGAPAPAPVVPECSSQFSTGFYGGIQGGWLHYRNKSKFSFSQNGIVDVDVHKHAHKNGVVGQIFLGWMLQTANCWMWGLEIDGALDSAKTKKTFFGIIDVKSHRKWAVIPALWGGYAFTPNWMVYLKAGLGISEFKIELRDKGEPLLRFSKHHNKVQVGFVPTAGLSYAIDQKWSLRGEVSAELYHHQKVRHTNPITLGTYEGRTSNNRLFSVQVGVAYHL